MVRRPFKIGVFNKQRVLGWSPTLFLFSNSRAAAGKGIRVHMDGQ